jgi:hypothetical protein
VKWQPDFETVCICNSAPLQGSDCGGLDKGSQSKVCVELTVELSSHGDVGSQYCALQCATRPAFGSWAAGTPGAAEKNSHPVTGSLHMILRPSLLFDVLRRVQDHPVGRDSKVEDLLPYFFLVNISGSAATTIIITPYL